MAFTAYVFLYVFMFYRRSVPWSESVSSRSKSMEVCVVILASATPWSADTASVTSSTVITCCFCQDGQMRGVSLGFDRHTMRSDLYTLTDRQTTSDVCMCMRALSLLGCPSFAAARAALCPWWRTSTGASGWQKRRRPRSPSLLRSCSGLLGAWKSSPPAHRTCTSTFGEALLPLLPGPRL